MNKFTPGPWAEPVYEDGEGDDEGYWIYNGQEGIEQYAVAYVVPYNPSANGDAYLIASAPDLLAALEVAVQSMLDSGYAADSVVIRASRAAINKAKGES